MISNAFNHDNDTLKWTDYTKRERKLLQSVAGITKSDKNLLQNAAGIAKSDSYCKVRHTILQRLIKLLLLLIQLE